MPDLIAIIGIDFLLYSQSYMLKNWSFSIVLYLLTCLWLRGVFSRAARRVIGAIIVMVKMSVFAFSRFRVLAYFDPYHE